MSDEIKLSEELAACEARLAAQTLPQPAINRDQLMYQAGWAACEAQLGSGAATSILRRGHGFGAAWSFVSTAIAASLAVVVALQWRAAGTADIAAKAPGREVVASTAHAELAASQPSIEYRLPPMLDRRTRALNSSLLDLRRHALMNIWPESEKVTAVSTTAAEPASKTSRELMQELLPAESAGTIRNLSPSSHRMGESI